MPDGVVIVEVPSLKLLFANDFAKTITEAKLGRPANLDLTAVEGEVLYPDGRRYEPADWPIMRSTRGEKVVDEDCVYVLPDGRSITLRLSCAPIYDSGGKVVAAVAVGRDVSDQDRRDH